MRACNAQTRTTVLPTALSATLYAVAHGTFMWSRLRHRQTKAEKTKPWVSGLKLLEPARAIVARLCWGLGWTSRRVVWRGNAFLVGRGSKLSPVDATWAAAEGDAAS